MILYRALLSMTRSFNRVGNAPRFVFQISNLKSQIRNFKYNNRGPLGTRLNEPSDAFFFDRQAAECRSQILSLMRLPVSIAP
jgi:hypothetical protein